MAIDPDLVRIYVGTDRSQALGFEVLKYSILKHATIPVEVHPMLDLGLPEPADPRQGKRTGFSFSRFAIPRLAGYQGKALYLDADMQVFSDIKNLWRMPFDGAKVVIQEVLGQENQHVDKTGAPKKRIRQCSVMLLDCERLPWVPEDIIAKLGNEYQYEDLLYHLCILREEDIAERIPFTWNSLEHWDERTNLIHYTDMHTQPWASNHNPFGWVWVNEFKEMLEKGVVSWEELEGDIKLGYIRPSLPTELRLDEDLRHPNAERTKRLDAIDKEAKFVMHKEVYDNKRKRQAAIKAYEAKLREQGIDPASVPVSSEKPPGMLERVVDKIASVLR